MNQELRPAVNETDIMINSYSGKAIEFLLERGSLPVLYWLKRDILDVPYEREIRNLKKYAARVRILESQRPDGSWCDKLIENSPAAARARAIADTLKNLYKLYDFGCTLDDEEIRKAIVFIFTTQSKQGDFRSVHSDECAPAFHALSLEILCRYGLDEDRRVQRGFRWIAKSLAEAEDWFPSRNKASNGSRPLRPSRSREAQSLRRSQRVFFQFIAGFFVRALAESSVWKKSRTARQAGEVILERFPRNEKSPRQEKPSCWVDITYPFWTNGTLSSLDSLSKLGFDPKDERIRKALGWLMNKQNASGFWESEGAVASPEDHLWVTVSVLRILKRFGIIHA